MREIENRQELLQEIAAAPDSPLLCPARYATLPARAQPC
jgi:hypothetical protein